MADTVEVLKPENERPALVQRKPRQGWTEITEAEVTQEPLGAKITTLSPPQSSSGDVNKFV